jgi:predicted secreted protein
MALLMHIGVSNSTTAEIYLSTLSSYHHTCSDCFDQKNFLQEKAVETHQAKRRKEETPHRPKPEDQEGMPQYQHCHAAAL